MRRKIAIILAAVSFMLLFTGCWDYKEVEQLAVVAGCAIDKGTAGKKYHLTVEIVGMSGESKSPQPKPVLLESDGNTVFEAIRDMTSLIENKLYWSNTQIIILGKEVASEGIINILDFFLRDHEPRPTIEVFVSSEATAKDVLQLKSSINKMNSFKIDTTYENDPKTLSNTYYQQLYQVFNTIRGQTTDLTLPVIHGIMIDGEKTAQLSGLAVFNGEKMVGYLSPEDTRFFNFVIDKIKGGILTFQTEGKVNGAITLEIYKNKTKIKPVYKNGKLTMEISTNTQVAGLGIETNSNIMTENNRETFVKKAESQLAADITRTIRKVQKDYGVDIFGFGSIISKNDPKLWDKVQGKWKDMFPNVDINVTSKIDIRNTYLTK